MDDDIARLIREQRIADAAALASARGDATTASALFERACEWHLAATEALRTSDAGRAMRLSVLSRDDALIERALANLVASPQIAEHVAVSLEAHGDHAWAARIFESVGRSAEAARAWDRAGNAVRAAELLEAAHDVVGAARVLETAARRAPLHWPNHLALGGLLVRYGKAQAAARTLQGIPPDAAERLPALRLLVRALEQLGLEQAAAEARRELAAMGEVPAPEEPAAPLRPSRPPATRIYGRYEVVREIASTPSSRVLECIDTVRGERVAIKIYAGYSARGAGRDVLARFEREQRVLASIDHPNVVPLRDYFPDGPALVLDWMPGGTLEEMLARGPIAPARAVEIACALLGALEEAHRVGVLHRDIKPSNVLFDGAGTARLADFGAAHLGDLSATATAGVIGTLSYMSPEQRAGEPASLASDLYGVGAVLLEMLTGELGDIARLPSANHRDLDARHDTVVHALVALDPARRPSDARSARRALTALPWPSWFGAPAPRPSAPSEASRRRSNEMAEESARVRVGVAGQPDVDAWLERPILRVPLDPPTLARASAFARAEHPGLQIVYRVDRRAGEIWLDANDRPLDRWLTDEDRTRLASALDALHRAGIVHGNVHRSHVRLDPSGAVLLRFAPPAPDARGSHVATADHDREALLRLV
ncbi:protein kinase [Pendulispora brunnea]|uniref:Protein kinase n=1 Tax=Pendulispora brunnea TaxID=2905690 RepID=A0ABZ2KUL5_9BACT